MSSGGGYIILIPDSYLKSSLILWSSTKIMRVVKSFNSSRLCGRNSLFKSNDQGYIKSGEHEDDTSNRLK